MNSITRNHSVFTLLSGTEEIASFKYNRENNSIRINSVERRLFFLSQAGLLQNKILLNTEYGVSIGENYPIRHHHKGVLHVGENKFTYTIGKNTVEICDRRKMPLVNFRLNDADALDIYEAAAVLFSIVWLYIHSELSEATAHKASGLYVS